MERGAFREEGRGREGPRGKRGEGREGHFGSDFVRILVRGGAEMKGNV